MCSDLPSLFVLGPPYILLLRYFLNLFGLRGLFSLSLEDENAIDDTQRMMQMGGFGFDASKLWRWALRRMVSTLFNINGLYRVRAPRRVRFEKTRAPERTFVP
ncbi:hypothetical protein F2Q70_00013269 [Brassica cretica]|uniref:Uncharacterized protein n=1 Tax=Brassica cretica TaxID=69181 RepID=A0A8S9MAS5_BRACR|nr:hypothetical protein F2Q70_00013269 [Brassica cretica]